MEFEPAVESPMAIKHEADPSASTPMALTTCRGREGPTYLDVLAHWRRVGQTRTGQVWLHMRQTTAASPGGIGVSTCTMAPAALELGSATMGQLIDWRSQIDAQLALRNMVRTRGPVTGELMQRVVADAYQAPLTKPATKSVDMIHLGRV